MSKSLARVTAALAAAGVETRPVQMPDQTRTAQQAADAAGCALDQIAKSIILAGRSGKFYLFLTAGGAMVDMARAATLAGEPLARADAEAVRAATGFAIGGVAPIGHIFPLSIWMDETLLRFDTVWAAAGTPNHIFAIDPKDLLRISGACQAAFTSQVSPFGR